MMGVVIDTTTAQKFLLGTCHRLVNAESGIQIVLLVSSRRPAVAESSNIAFLPAPTSFAVECRNSLAGRLRDGVNAWHHRCTLGHGWQSETELDS